MFDVLLLAAAIALFATPGAWIAFGLLGGELTATSRWSLCIALSPFVMAVQVLLLAAAGIGFEEGCRFLAFANLGAIAVIARTHGRAPGGPASKSLSWTYALCLGLLFLTVIPLWIGVPHYRVYSWHNLLQVSACHQIAELPAIPEEMDLAGMRLRYPWLGLVQLTAIAKLVDRPPTLLFPLANLAMLWATFTALYGAARRMRPKGRAGGGLAAISVALALLGTNLLGMVGGLLTDSPWVIGDPRYTPLTGKFGNLDSMVPGLALLACTIEVSVAALGAVRPRSCLLLPVLALAVGLTYPLLFPPAGLLAGLLAVVLWQGRLAPVPAYTSGVRVAMVAGLGIACALVFAYLRFLTGDQSSQVLSFGVKRVLFNAAKLPLSIGPWVLLATPVVNRAWQGRDTPTLFLAAGALATGVLFVASRLPNSAEYKFAFAMFFCLVPLAASRIEEWLDGSRRRRMAWAGGTLALFWLVGLGFSLRFNIPWHTLAHAVVIDESGFGIRMLPGPESDWIDAIRQRTPAETLVLVEESTLPISILTQRSSYLAADGRNAGRSGYSMRRKILLEQNGYPPGEIARRTRVLEAAFQATDPGDFAWLSDEIQRLHRPAAIVFGQPGSAYLSWLRANGVGREIFRARDRVVWLIGDRTETGPRAPLPGG